MPSNAPHRSRLTVSAVFAAAVTLVVAGVTFAGASVGPNTDHITVTQELSQSEQEGCAEVPEAVGPLGADVSGAMSMATSDTPDAFTIVVTVPMQLCEEFPASAVIYLMPSASVAWPQELSEKVEFTLYEAGTTTIRFDKYCVPAQFDVIQGNNTPQTVNAPGGPYHGPLLFPNNLQGEGLNFFGGSALQYDGAGDCTTTSTSTTTTSTTTTTTSSTVPVTIEGVTTTVTSASVPSNVEGSSTSRSNAAGLSVAG